MALTGATRLSNPPLAGPNKATPAGADQTDSAETIFCVFFRRLGRDIGNIGGRVSNLAPEIQR